jgi:predicted ArsR family transcriptional regulator
MNICIDENSTRKNIILLLKKSGGMSIDELSKVIDITPMGIRQHLLALEKKGVITYVTKRRGIGRPGFRYLLTEAADVFFPHSYDEFSLNLLRDIKKYDGPEKIDKIFSWRRERILRKNKETLNGKESLEDILSALRQNLESEGHLVDLSRNNGHYHLTQYHCPISRISSEFKEACKHELQLYRDLIGKNVVREQALSEGALSCLYLIPRN